MLDHDVESGLDHAQFRKYASTQGHWMSPDPYSGSSDWANSQSLNRYAYVLNGPLSSMDASGLCPLCLSFYFWNEGAQTLQVFALSPVVVGLVAGGVALGALVVDELGKWLGWWSSNFNGVAGSPRPDVPNKSPCANDTLAQAGVDARQQITQAQGAMLNSPGPFGTISAYAGPVGTGGPNDIKNLPGHSPQNSIDVAVGNISYGITCPFEAGFCQFAAGLAQTFGGNPDFNGSFKTGFDTPADNAQIRTGQAMRAAGCRE